MWVHKMLCFIMKVFRRGCEAGKHCENQGAVLLVLAALGRTLLLQCADASRGKTRGAWENHTGSLQDFYGFEAEEQEAREAGWEGEKRTQVFSSFFQCIDSIWNNYDPAT